MRVIVKRVNRSLALVRSLIVFSSVAKQAVIFVLVGNAIESIIPFKEVISLWRNFITQEGPPQSRLGVHHRPSYHTLSLPELNLV